VSLKNPIHPIVFIYKLQHFGTRFVLEVLEENESNLFQVGYLAVEPLSILLPNILKILLIWERSF
jgi:hypothetical protein